MHGIIPYMFDCLGPSSCSSPSTKELHDQSDHPNGSPVYLQHLEGLQVRDVGDHVGREGELFAVDQQMQRTVHLKSDM